MKVEYLNISRRVGLIDKFIELGYTIGVEVGTDRGGYAFDICSRYPELKLYTIDPWLPYKEGSEVKDKRAVEALYNEAKQTLKPFNNCTIIRKKSLDAVNDFKDNSLDFVFIDGDHTYSAVFNDIVAWTKKVKHGGMIIGHDYKEDKERNYGVIKAVNDYVGANKIDTLYILRKGSYVDCWLFIRP